MFLILVYFTILNLSYAISRNYNQHAYQQNREKYIDNEVQNSVGGNILLNLEEEIANSTLMSCKLKELDHGFKNPTLFPPARNFFKAKKDIEESKIFSFLKRVPKGAALHMHSTSMVSADFVIKNLTYEYTDNLYVKITRDNKLERIGFFQKPPHVEWTKLKMLREQYGDCIEVFDDWLKSQISLDETDVESDINVVWSKFEGLFSLIKPFITYEPVWKAYFYQALQEFHDDNINYIEFRGSISKVYRLDGTMLTEEEVCQLYIDIIEKFKSKNPTFFGAKLIYARARFIGRETLRGMLSKVVGLKKAFPDFVAGFDLVGQEDLGGPLESFASEFLEFKQEVDYFFHAGETNWSGFSTDFNLLDAILIGTKRIGHGYAITKHPMIAKLVKDQRVGIEICPISNQVLGLVKDLRNHPGAHLLTNDFPVVIAPDDPAFWGAKGVSYDWYQAFMGFGAKWQDLRLLKQLAINSIEFSSLDDLQKKKFLSQWEKQWRSFVQEISHEKDCEGHLKHRNNMNHHRFEKSKFVT